MNVHQVTTVHIDQINEVQNALQAWTLKKTQLTNAEISQIANAVTCCFSFKENSALGPDGRKSQVTYSMLHDGLTSALKSEEKESYKFWRDEDGKVRYLVRRIGAGKTSKVYWFVDLQEHTACVFKDARRKNVPDVEKTRSSVQREYENLKTVLSNGKVWGIQDLPHESVRLKLLSKKTASVKYRNGVLHPLYNGGREKLLPIDYLIHTHHFRLPYNDDLLIDLHQFLYALFYLHDHDFFHGDIKLENFLMHNQYVHLTDFGGMVTKTTDIRELVAGGGYGLRMASPPYTCKCDLIDSLRCAKQGLRGDVMQIEKAREVFSMGIVIYCAITGVNPYKEAEPTVRGFPTGSYTDITEPNVPVEIKDLVRRMCCMDRTVRPTAQAAFQEFEAYVNKYKPQISQKILQLMQDGGYAIL